MRWLVAKVVGLRNGPCGRDSTGRRTRKVALVLVGSAVCGSSWMTPTSFGQRQRPAVRGPQLVIEQTRHDFGEAFAGEALPHTFSLRNAGTAPLELSDKLPVPRVGSYTLADGSPRPRVAAFSTRPRPAAAAPQ
jgi:hypothetical protein